MKVRETVAGVPWVFERDPQTGMWIGQADDRMSCLAASLQEVIEHAEEVVRLFADTEEDSC